MNSAKYLDEQISILKKSGIPCSEQAWQAALLCVGWAYVFGARGAYCTPSNRRSAYRDAYPTIKTACQNFDGDKSCVGCKWYPNCERTRFFDCRGFTYWVLLQIYGWKLMGAGCTSQWNNEDNWCAKGEVADGIPQGVIVCLFYYKKDSKGKRTSTLSHTGLYYNGQTVECSNNVQHSKTLNKKWEVWAIPKCAEAEYRNPGENAPVQPSEPSDDKESLPMLKRGDRGEKVRLLQEILVRDGFSVGKCGIDGIFGKDTESAVKAYQKKHGLTVNGIVDSGTWEALERISYYVVTIHKLTKEKADEIVKKYGGSINIEGG